MLRGLYLLPSLFTSANLVAGILSIILSIENEFTPAAWAIILSMLMDMIDGRVARWTKTTSSFGIEFDSLADLVAFGVAPSILMYQMMLHTMHRPGIAIAVFYALCGALRLARFNTKAQGGEPTTHFLGLPIPAGAGILASFALSYELFEGGGGEITAKSIPLLMHRMPFFFKSIPILMVVIALLMVSTVPYAAFKKFKFNRPKSLQLFILILIGFLLVLTYPQNTIFIIFLMYLLSGLLGYVWRYFRLRQAMIRAARVRRSMESSPDDQQKKN